MRTNRRKALPMTIDSILGCSDIVELLDEVKARTGKLQGVIVITVSPGDVEVKAAGQFEDNLQVVGAIEVAKSILLEDDSEV